MDRIQNVADMGPGQTAVITGFLDDHLSAKLIEMGFIPGTPIQFNFFAPLGDPVCVTVSGYDLSIRLAEAASITVRNE